jgi:hypothetical protein
VITSSRHSLPRHGSQVTEIKSGRAANITGGGASLIARFRVTHGGVRLINHFVLAPQRLAIAEKLGQAQADVVVVGHFGVPYVVRTGSGIW